MTKPCPFVDGTGTLCFVRRLGFEAKDARICQLLVGRVVALGIRLCHYLLGHELALRLLLYADDGHVSSRGAQCRRRIWLQLLFLQIM